MQAADRPLSAGEIEQGVASLLDMAAASSVRSYLSLNTPDMFVRASRGVYRLHVDHVLGLQPELPELGTRPTGDCFSHARTELLHLDCFDWFRAQPECSLHAIVTDPPYGLHEYTPEQQSKLRLGQGGVWRIPPAFDGHERSPLPRFTTLTPGQLGELRSFFYAWARCILPKLVPGANVLVASNPLLSHVVSGAFCDAGLERRGEVIRLVMTMRGGDRPKAAHEEFADVSVMPRSMWEPWLVYRRPIEGRVQDNLRKWRTGGFRRPADDRPFGDVIRSAPTRSCERQIAPHPSLKPQAFMRQIVRGALPLGEGVVVDPFAGAGSTLAAAAAVGYRAIGMEKDRHYFEMACNAIPRLAALAVDVHGESL
jgi:site-specific DNA-methyltransferase (adenine-specific)